jgi:hypothetical protein
MPVTVSVMDVSSIAEATARPWDAVVIFATNQSGKLASGVEGFLRSGRIRFTLVVTAGSGKWRQGQGLDAIATASKSANHEPGGRHDRVRHRPSGEIGGHRFLTGIRAAGESAPALDTRAEKEAVAWPDSG